MSKPFVIFDFDGVIADTERLHLLALQQTLAAHAVTLDAAEYEAEFLGYTDRDLLKALSTKRGVAWPAHVLESMVTDKAKAFDALMSTADPVFPSAARCIARLASFGATLAIASGAYRSEIDAILRRAGLRAHFPVIVGAEDYVNGKPSPDPFLEAARQAGREPGTAVVIEDSPWGLAAARAAGCAAIAVTHSYGRDRLNADVTVDSLDDIDEPMLDAALKANA